MLSPKGKPLAAAALAVASLVSGASAQTDVDRLQQSFIRPPDDAKIMFRWWWFGPAVTHGELEREMKEMKAAGVGGFEVQPTYPLALDDERPGQKNLKFMSPEHLEALRFTAAKAKELGLRMDLTLGSGWPYGGPQFSRYEAAGALVNHIISVPAGAKRVALPPLKDGETLMAAFLGPTGTGLGTPRVARGRALDDASAPPPAAEGVATGFKPAKVEKNEVLISEGSPAESEILYFVAGQTGMKVKRPAAGAEGYVIDHLAAEPVEKFIREIAEPAIAACAPNAPFAVFCDSLEVGGENWTPNMLAEFRKRRGYDLAPLLPALVGDIGPKTEDVRHDWLMTCTELYNEYFNARFQKLAAQYGTRFRIQGYGSPPAALHSYAYADLCEGEGYDWRNFDETRWAASASHLLGRKVTSSETWTWLHSVVFRATPLDMKAEADIHFLQGVNQLIGHGWPYTAEGAAYPGWSFYAAGAFNEKNPWWIAMPDVSTYLQRVSHMMREGTPSNDVLVYLPNSDAWASRSSSINHAVGPKVSGKGDGGIGNITGSLLASGYNLDYFDDQLLAMRGKIEGNTIAFGDVKYRAVVLPPTERIMPATMKMLDGFARGGGVVVAVGHAPKQAPGYLATEADQQIVHDAAQHLISTDSPVGSLIPNASELASTLSSKGLRPDVAVNPSNPGVGFVHRHTSDAEIYFVANTLNEPVSSTATFRVEGLQPELWNPLTGAITPATTVQSSQGGTGIAIDLPAYGSTIVVFTKRALAAAPNATASAAPATRLDLSSDWTVRFGKQGQPVKMQALQDWAADERTKAFSGVARYEKSFNLPAESIGKGAKVILDLGSPKPARDPGVGQGYRANLDAPVREVAVVYANDERVGAVWAPPYAIDVTAALKPGENRLRIDVANTAMNYMKQNPYPNYNLRGIREVYGNRFDPQGLNLVDYLPSGLTGPITLNVTAVR